MLDRITVTAHDDELGSMDEFANRLRAAGLQIDQVLGPVGLVTGSVDRTKRASLKRVRGVAGIEDQAPFQLAPPDADIQ